MALIIDTDIACGLPPRCVLTLSLELRHCTLLTPRCCIALLLSSCCHVCRLPQRRVLTLNLELPESWLVEPVMALHDFDNLRLADVHEQVRTSSQWAISL